mmetsp:Transcript_40145/g.54618  ORF Transcript_40145/g.54618 Transcript_40145/m.54618 type:complete len:117 (-) Transcript_40145:219-569(-)|eukprot:CAMPEP_0185774276 /NCGR_PEP_ID=MMETSP1174-20130828/77456_1 /TAXON_ID=35687 /ORGANISM="Dictyocha speculum, Strain CCMP1381" /LENGTH=116 /DNA_ID=CAMNT_0028461363 /DNA_START=22 /DNA_END=372 /DNA_ORIENTATION=-
MAASSMTEITSGVCFDTIAKEIRCKWSGDNDKASLASAQEVLDNNKETVKSLPGFKAIQRVVCGDCLDFKIISSFDGSSFDDAMKDFPGDIIVDALKAIDGISNVETQVFTLMPVE